MVFLARDHEQFLLTSLLDEGPEGCYPSARPYHNDGETAVLGEPKVGVLADENWTCAPHSQPVLEVGGTDPRPGLVQQGVSDHCHTYTHRLSTLQGNSAGIEY